MLGEHGFDATIAAKGTLSRYVELYSGAEHVAIQSLALCGSM